MEIEEKEESNERERERELEGTHCSKLSVLFEQRLVFFVRTSIIFFSFLLNSLKEVTGDFSEIKATVV